MIGEIVAELAVLATSQGWEFVGLVTADNGEKVIAMRRQGGDAIQITLTPGRAEWRGGNKPA